MNLLSVFVFAFVSGITPGPNNTLLLRSGARFGFGQTLPHILGITFGMSILFLLVGAGLGGVIQSQPGSAIVLYAVSTALIAYLAAKIVTRPFPKDQQDHAERAWSFTRAALFQWINPKIWMMALGVYGSSFGLDSNWKTVSVITLLFAFVCIPTMSFWAAFGSVLQGILRDPVKFRVVHAMLGVGLAASWIV